MCYKTYYNGLKMFHIENGLNFSNLNNVKVTYGDHIKEIGTDYIIILNCAGFFYVKVLTQ